MHVCCVWCAYTIKAWLATWCCLPYKCVYLLYTTSCIFGFCVCSCTHSPCACTNMLCNPIIWTVVILGLHTETACIPAQGCQNQNEVHVCLFISNWSPLRPYKHHHRSGVVTISMILLQLGFVHECTPLALGSCTSQLMRHVHFCMILCMVPWNTPIYQGMGIDSEPAKRHS